MRKWRSKDAVYGMRGAHPAERVALQIEIAPRSDEIERGLID